MPFHGHEQSIVIAIEELDLARWTPSACFPHPHSRAQDAARSLGDVVAPHPQERRRL